MGDSPSGLGPYDPALLEAIRERDADEEVAVIVRLSGPSELPPDVRVVTRFGEIATLRVRLSRLAELAASDSIVAMEASRRLRLSDSGCVAASPEPGCTAESEMPAPYTRRPEGLTATGRGVVVASLDFGVDPAHPAFRRADGSTRILAFWDQRAKGGGGAGNRWGYGRIFTPEEIDEALAEEDPYRTLGYDPADSDEADAAGSWLGSHGAHVLDIAAGNGMGGGMSGVAPQADLICVQLSRTTQVLGRGNLGDSATVLEALDFVFSAAGGRPCVVNMSIGAQGGPHDGSTLVEQGIDQAVWLEKGRVVINSGGNYFNRRAHASGRVASGEDHVLRFHVPADDPTGSEIELFYESIDRFSVTVFGPSGAATPRIEPGAGGPLVVGGDTVGYIYHYLRQNTSGDHHIDLFLRPGAPPGDWELRLTGEVVSDGHFHAWIERDRGLSPHFTGTELDTNSTTGTLCNGKYSITVGAYDPFVGGRPMGAFSSAGPTRDGRVKPEIIAPGVAIVAARSNPRGEPLGARYTRKSGTSMAAPHVTGAVALMMEAAGRPMSIVDLRALLFGSAERASADEVLASGGSLNRIGYGYLDLVAAECAAREWGELRASEEFEEGEMAESIENEDQQAEAAPPARRGAATRPGFAAAGYRPPYRPPYPGRPIPPRPVPPFATGPFRPGFPPTTVPYQPGFPAGNLQFQTGIPAAAALPIIGAGALLTQRQFDGAPLVEPMYEPPPGYDGSFYFPEPGMMEPPLEPEPLAGAEPFLEPAPFEPPSQMDPAAAWDEQTAYDLGDSITFGDDFAEVREAYDESDEIRYGPAEAIVSTESVSYGESVPENGRETAHCGCGRVSPYDPLTQLRRATTPAYAAGTDIGLLERPLAVPTIAETPGAFVCAPAEELDPAREGIHPKIRRGSRNATVGHAQELLNRFLASAAASPSSCVDNSAATQTFINGGLGTLASRSRNPLPVDCSFDINMELATKMFQACLQLNRDGAIGPETWGPLEWFFNPALPAPTLLARPCCLLQGQSGNLLDPGALGTQGSSSEALGLLYTGKAGFVDLGHTRETADITQIVHAKLTAAGGPRMVIRTPHGIAAIRRAPANPAETAASIAFDDALGHEIVSWDFLLPGMRNSSFSPEDLVSNFLGCLVGQRAIARVASSGGTFEAAATAELKSLLTSLDVQTKAETLAAFNLINSRWVHFTGAASLVDPRLLLRRNFTRTPFKAGHASDAATPAFVTAAFSAGVKDDYDYFHMESGKVLPRRKYDDAIARVKREAKAEFGADFDKP